MHPRVGGVWLASIAPYGEVTWSHGEHGCKEASFTVSLPKGTRHPALTGRPLVELMDGPFCVWSGELAEPDWTEMKFTAQGLAYGAERFQCLDINGDATARPDVAIDRANDRGWNVSRGDGIPTTAYTDAAEGPNMVADLLGPVADELGQWWTVRADRIVRMAAAPTTPTWHLVPHVVDLGNADDDFASTINVRYRTTTGGYATEPCIDATAAGRFGVKEYPLDVTEYGPMTQARAQGIGAGILAKGRSRLGWTGSIEVSPNMLTTAGGVPAPLSMVESHQLVRIFGIYDDLLFLGGRTYLDAVIGETGYADGSDVITLSPLGSVADTFAEIVEDALNIAGGKKAA